MPSKPVKTLHLGEKLLKITAAVEYLKKDKEVQGYKAVTHDAVTAAIRKEMVKYGVVVTVDVTDMQVTELDRTSSGGTPATRAQVKIKVTYWNAHDMRESVGVEGAGYADDYGDKADGKAISYATKYTHLKTFLIETGEDEESRNITQSDTVTISGVQLEKLRDTLKAAGREEDAVLRWIDRQYGISIPSLAQLPRNRLGSVQGTADAALAKLEAERGN